MMPGGPMLSNASMMGGAPMNMMTGNPSMMNNLARGPQGVMMPEMVQDFSQMGPQTMRSNARVMDAMPGMPGETVIAEKTGVPQAVASSVIGSRFITQYILTSTQSL